MKSLSKLVVIFLLSISLYPTDLKAGWIEKWTLCPGDSDLIRALVGRKVVFQKGLLFDNTWTIEKSEISDLEILGCTKADSNNIFGVTINFKVVNRGRGLEITAIQRWQDFGKVGTKFVDFAVAKTSKIGNW